MYGLQGKITAKPGQRNALIALLIESAGGPPMPGCRLYVVSEVPAEPDAVAITEAWDDKAAHDASLQLERVRSVIARAAAHRRNGRRHRAAAGRRPGAGIALTYR